MACLTGTSPIAVASWPIRTFNRFHHQVPWLVAYLRNEMAGVVLLPTSKKGHVQKFFAAIQRAFDTRTNEERWADAPNVMEQWANSRRGGS